MQEFIDENETADEELYEHHRFEIAKGQQALRIDKFLLSKIEGATRSKVQKGIDNGLVLVNNNIIKANYKVRPDDEIITFSEI